MNQSYIDSNGRFFGSVIYEEYLSDELVLNFVTAPLDREENDTSYDYP